MRGDYRSGDPAVVPMDYVTSSPSIIVRVQTCPAAATTHSPGVLSLSLLGLLPSLSPISLTCFRIHLRARKVSDDAKTFGVQS